ncbi:MAG: tRNA (adenosine(37)-N6)-dimethylallyltransferase MiaA [Candidatus Saccharibacteria bacterium]|nr:tRNA (adenosine(37)-N6)-dimethylallyltransferase MiaA [Candidatus Saccharibacteria bacterium]
MQKRPTIKNNLPLIVILGSTGTGKTAISLELASKIGGEIICADSRTVYRHMNIGTAKPSDKDRAKIKHWCLDLVNPNERFTVADFKIQAQIAINDIRSRGKYPILVGGSGLYIDSVIFNFDLLPKANQKLRQELNILTTGELQQHCIKNNIILPNNYTNRRHLIRKIETNGAVVKNTDILSNTIVMGIDVEKTTLRKRVANRVEQMLKDGLLQETEYLYKNYNTKLESMTANVYSLANRYRTGEINKKQFIELATIRDMQLVKKQRTWFRRNQHIIWLRREEVIPYLLRILDNK